MLLAACLVVSPAAGQHGATDKQALIDEIRASLQKDVLDVWYPRAVDTKYGGYLSNFAHDWAVMPEQDKMIVTQARHIWTTSKAAAFIPEQRDDYLAIAAHGIDFLREKLWDDEHGGFYSLVTRKGEMKQGNDPFTQGKTAYGNTFALYALAAYHGASGDTASLNFARRTFQWMDAHMHDDEYGGYFQFVERDGTPLKTGWGPHPAKDQNSSIHILEAFTELYAVWPDETLRNRLEEMLVLVRDTITTDPGTLQLFFHADWTPLSYRDSTEAVRQAHYNMDHVSYGHDVETAFLMLEAAHALGLDPAPTLAAGKRMVDHALAYGWDDEVGGLYDGGYYLDPDAPPLLINSGKTWWAQAEMLNTMLLMARHFPNDEHAYYDRFETMWVYIQRYLIDHEHGGWYGGGLDQEPDYKTAPKGSIWKASYHDGRALMNVVHLLEGAH